MNLSYIKKEWPLPEPIQSIKTFPRGAINLSFSVRTARGRYVLRLYRHKSIAQIRFETKLLQYISKLPVPRIVSVRGKKIFFFNKKPAIIYKYIPGIHRKLFSAADREQIGMFLARFHKEGTGFAFSGNRERLYDFSSSRLGLIKKNVKRGTAYYKRFGNVFSDVKQYRLPKNLPEGPIHVDVKPDNVLFSEKKLSGIIDFDNAYIGPLVLDLAKSMVWFGIERKRFRVSYAKDILRGYERIRPLPLSEKNNIYRAVKFAFASHLFIDFYMNSKGAIPHSYFKFLMRIFYPAYVSFDMAEEAFFKALGLHIGIENDNQRTAHRSDSRFRKQRKT